MNDSPVSNPQQSDPADGNVPLEGGESVRHPGGGNRMGCLAYGCLGAVACLVVQLLLLVWSAHAVKSRFSTLTESMHATGASAPFKTTPSAPLNLGVETTEESPKVLHVPIRGTILETSPAGLLSLPEYGDPALALRSISTATADPSIRAIFLDIDSPGGEVTYSDIVWKALQNFKAADTNRCVVALFGSTAASGAYYIAAAADWIVANPTTLTGSIGVKIDSFNLEQLMEKIGVQNVSLTSGANKNILSPFEPLTEEQQRMLQNIIDTLHTRFVKLVADGRHLDEPAVRALADGRILLAPEAQAAGLVDALGYFAEARAELARRLGAMPVFVTYTETDSLLRQLLGPSPLGTSLRAAGLSAAWQGRGTGVPQYR